MSDAPWYPVTPAFPPLNTRVRVHWDGREFLASRIISPKLKKRVWGTITAAGDVQLLPPPRLAERWGADPACWQPLDAAAWRGPLPDMLQHTSRGGMRSERQRFQAVEDAEASELAREMERNRSAVRASVDDDADEAAEPQWWRDPHLVTYSPPGAVTPREVEGRYMRALLTEQWIMVEYPRDKTFSDILADMQRRAERAQQSDGDPTSDGAIRLQPTGRDRDDYLVVVAWRKALAVPGPRLKNAARLLELRTSSPPLGWRRIGDILGRSGEACRQLHARAIAELTKASNNQDTNGVVIAAQDLNRMRENCREFRRQERGTV